MNAATLALLYYLFYLTCSLTDPYVTLGISHSASQKEIKRAYKKLAMEWHPDKNDSPGASERFMEINQAYEILSDPERKQRYDRFGSFDEARPHGHHYHHSPFDEFFNFAFGGGFDSGGSSSFFENHRINFRMYTNSLLEKSSTKPFLLFAYSPYCHFCYRMENVWKEAVTDLEALGYGIGTVNAMIDGNLLEKLRVSQLPALMVLVEGRVMHFRGDFKGINAKVIRVFARNVIPSTFLHRINSFNAMKRFLDQTKATNKISVLFLGSQEEPRLRYLLSAMSNSPLAQFGYINIAALNDDVFALKEALDIKCARCESMLIFNEFPEQGPIAKHTSPDGQITTEQISNLLETHKFLMLPRISSMKFFDELCPVSSRTQRYLCIVLPITDSSSDYQYVNIWRKFIQIEGSRMLLDRIRITYIFTNQQQVFMEEFGEVENENNKRSLLALWRNEYVMAKYLWLPNILSNDELILHKTFENIKTKIYAIHHGSTRLEHTAKIGNVNDEYGPSWFTRVSRRLVRTAETLWFHVTKEEALPVLSVIGTFVFILFVGYFLNYLMVEDRQRTFAQHEKPNVNEQKEWHPEDPKIAPQRNPSMKSTVSSRFNRIWREMEPMIHELRAETQFGLIRLLKPGCRSIIILVDTESKDILLPQFARHIYPLRNNKTFSFGYLMVNKNLAWFRTILEHTLPVDSENPGPSSGVAQSMFQRLKCINPKQTLGTVLVLCGWKLYFCMYHPMHKATKEKNFVGFDDDEESSDSEDKYKESKEKILKKELNLDNVLNGLSNFLDRLLEGSVRRYYIPEWPDNLK